MVADSFVPGLSWLTGTCTPSTLKVPRADELDGPVGHLHHQVVAQT
jgi:hypothetical protein